MRPAQLIGQFRGARRDRSVAVLEGLHPLKHALRFGATVFKVVTGDRDLLARLCASLAPDVAGWILTHAETVPWDVFVQLAPVPPDTGVIALARRPGGGGAAGAGAPAGGAAGLLATPRTTPLVLLEQPSHLGNVGTAIRTAAAAGAAGVVTVGPQDPWHPTAIKGAAGLQFALPVARLESLPPDLDIAGPLLAIHPEGDPLAPGSIPSDAVLAFGSERRGLSRELLDRADQRLAIPMEPGVSSLNLAASVAIVLYCWRLGVSSGSGAA